MDPATSRRDVLRTSALGVGALAGMSAVSATAASPASAAATAALTGTSDIFLKIDGVDGESLDSKHPGEIEINSFSWGASNTGKVSVQDISIMTHVNKASPVLMLACATGQHFKKAVLTVRKSGGDQSADYMKLTLEDLLVTSYQNGADASSVPVDQLTINYFRVTFSYRPQNADGSLGAAVEATYPPLR